MKIKIINLIIIGTFFTLMPLVGMKKKITVDEYGKSTELAQFPIELQAKLLTYFPPTIKREMKTISKNIAHLLRLEDQYAEEALKNYFLYPYLSGVLNTLEKEIAQEIVNGTKPLFCYLLQHENWHQLKKCEEVIKETILQNKYYHTICYNNILNASIAYFNSNSWKNFFGLIESVLSAEDIKSQFNIESDNTTTIKKITCSDKIFTDYKSSVVDSIYIIKSDLKDSLSFQLLMKKLLKMISEEKYEKVRLVLTTKPKINKKELDKIMTVLNDTMKNNTIAAQKIKCVDLTILLSYLIKKDNNDIQENYLQILEKPENKVNSVIYIPKGRYLQNIIALNRQETPSIIPYPDCLDNIPKETAGLEHLTKNQLKIFLNNNCTLDMLHFLTLRPQNNHIASIILNKYVSLFAQYISPYILTFNNYSVISGIIGACFDLYAEDSGRNDLSINVIKQIIERYKVDTLAKMNMAQLLEDIAAMDILDEPSSLIIDFWYFLSQYQILIPNNRSNKK